MNSYRSKIVAVSVVAFGACSIIGAVWYRSILHAPNRGATILLLLVGCTAVIGFGVAMGIVAAVWVRPCPDIEIIINSEVMSLKSVDISRPRSTNGRHAQPTVVHDPEPAYMREALSLVEVG